MSTLKAIFQTPEQADEAMGDLKANGFAGVREEFPLREGEAKASKSAMEWMTGDAMGPTVTSLVPGGEFGSAGFVGPESGMPGFAFVNPPDAEGAPGKPARIGIAVDAGERQALARMILERNAAEAIREG